LLSFNIDVKVVLDFYGEILEVDIGLNQGEDMTCIDLSPAFMCSVVIVAAIVCKPKATKPVCSDSNMWQHESSLKLADGWQLSILTTS
jgi:hypothetical protein